MTTRSRLVCVVAALVLLPRIAQAQDPCAASATQFVFAPTKLAMQPPADHTATLGDGSPAITDYQVAYFLSGQNPNQAGVNPVRAAETVTKTAFTPVAGTTPPCYEAAIPSTPPTAPPGAQTVSAVRSHRAASATVSEAFGNWTVSNPFGPDPTAPLPPVVVRVKR